MSPAAVHAGDLLSNAERLLDARELDAAWNACQRAEAAGADPDGCSGVRWLIATLRGDFEGAWRENDAIRNRGRQDRHRFWTGEDFTGKRVILRCLHGYGDTVQMMRYAPLIARRAKSLVVEVPPTMVDLIRCFDGVGEVITWGAGAPEIPTPWDVQMEINELPYIFRTQLADLPVATEYLKLPDQFIRVEAPDPKKLRVGILWASGDWKPSRSVPASLLQRLLDLPDVEFWNLQGGAQRLQWERFSKGPHMHEAYECAESILRLAELIAQLDLILTPDTLAAHLAGALGRPAWVMLEYAADWRWQHGRYESPWYPSLRLFRQPQPQDWDSVMRAVQMELKQLATMHMKSQVITR